MRGGLRLIWSRRGGRSRSPDKGGSPVNNPAARARAKIIVRAWKDPEFKARLLADPKTVCRENGLELPEETNLEVLEQEHEKLLFIVPSDAPAPEAVREMTQAEVHANFDKRMGYGFGCCGFDFPKTFREKVGNQDLEESLAEAVALESHG